jgi:hypothetical protein
MASPHPSAENQEIKKLGVPDPNAELGAGDRPKQSAI